MPAPRAARLGMRKSVVPDPDLYGNQTDSDDSDVQPRASKPPPPPAQPKPAPARRNKGPQPVRGSVITDNGRRRSTRNSNESQESIQAAHSTKPEKVSSRSREAPDDSPPPRPKSATAKGKKRAAKERVPSEEDEQEVEEPLSRGPGSGKPAKAPSGSKRPRTDPDDMQEDAEEDRTAPVASGSQQAAAAPRRGFVPRAAANPATRPSKPRADFSTVLVDSSADDPEPFPFTTNPPTPHATTAAKRAASKVKQNPRAKVPRTARPPTESDEITPDDSHPPPVASTSRSRLTPPRQPGSDRAPLHQHETPVQVKNIAFRQGAGPGTPATAGRSSVRRGSARGSRNRGSSIGGGYDAVPHPQVADDKLYRSTDAEDPLAKRLRSIVSWSAQRTRDKVFRSTPLDKLDDAQTIAKDVMNEFIADICSLKVDTSVPYQEPSQSQDPEHLPPHPQNESNAAKMAELEESYAAIAAEQASRERLDTIYQSFFDRRATAHNAYPSTVYSSLGPPPAAVENLAKYAAALDLSRPAPKSLEEALELGKSLLRGEGVKKEEKTGGTGGKKGKGKEKVEESDGLDRQILDAQIDTAHMRQLTHRLTSFSRVASAYITHRSSETHRALAAQAQQGLLDSTPTSGSTRPGDAAREAATPGLAGALASTTAAADEAGRAATGSLDMRDLLRALSRADTGGR